MNTSSTNSTYFKISGYITIILTPFLAFSFLGESVETYYNRAMAYYREKNSHEAFRIFLEAANRGNLLASSYLDFMHEKGQGTTRDYHKAIDYYALAGNSGIPGARYNLGLMFYEGRPGHLQKDYAIALYWFSQAAESKHDMAENYIGSIYH